jgi:hypothetical protein
MQGRSLLGFYIGLGVVAVVVGLGVWIFEPVKKRYAISQYKKANSEREVAGWIWRYLFDSASNGDREAFETLLSTNHPCQDFVIMKGPGMTREQRAFFYDIVSRSSDSNAVLLLGWLSYGICNYYGTPLDAEGANTDVESMIILMEELSTSSDDPHAKELATEFVPIARRRGIEVLIGMLKQADSYERCRAVWSLGDLKDPRAIKPLEELSSDPEAGVRAAAAEALKKIRGEEPSAGSPGLPQPPGTKQ